MKIVLVDAMGAFVYEEEGVYQPLYELLETYPNRKIVLTMAPDDLMEKWGLNTLPYEVYTSKLDPKKTDPKYYEQMLAHFNLKPKECVYFEHNPEAVKVAEASGIKSHFYDGEKKDLEGLKEFLDATLTEMKNHFDQNEKAWDAASNHFVGTGVLPSWGALGEGSDLDLIRPSNKRILEIGCGTGHSILRLIEQGANEVVGVDISERQLDQARSLTEEHVLSGKVTLFQSPMEKLGELNLAPGFDYIFSVYGLGWCTDLQALLPVLRKLLNKEGKLIFSFEHPLYALTNYKDGAYSFEQEYGDYEKVLTNWLGTGTDALLTYRTPETWFGALKEAGFTSIEYYEPRPVLDPDSIEDTDLRSYYVPEKYRHIPLTMLFVCQ